MQQLLPDVAGTDRIGFDPVAKILKDVILNTKPPFAVGIFGEWGSGKTTLMQMVETKLTRSKRVKTVWFNAWKYDGKEVIWNALIQSVFYRMREDPDVTIKPDLLKKITDTATNLAFFVARKTAPILTAGAIDDKAVDELRGALSPLSANDESFGFINTFEATFAEIVREYVGPQGRLVIFIDDLDRCLPENAVQVMESIKLYLDSPNVSFVIGVEPEVVRTGIRARYKENAALAEKEYLEKIVQLPFVMRGLDRDAAMQLIRPYGKADNYVGDDMVIDLILTATETNPRRIKRFINSFYVLSRIHLAAGETMGPDDIRRLALTLLTQMRFREVYADLVDSPGLIADFNNMLLMPTSDRDTELAKNVALKRIYEDTAARRFLEIVRGLDCSAAAMSPWVLFTQGEEAAVGPQ